MKYLVTGAGGFIGGYVAKAFAKKSNIVYGTYRRHKPHNLEEVENLKLIWTDFEDLSQLPRDIDFLIHCGADTTATGVSEEQLIKSNTKGSLNIFSYASKCPSIKKIVYLSSMDVFGKIKVPIVSELTPLEEQNYYGKSKYKAECFLEEIAEKNKKISCISIRLPGVVGNGSRNNFISNTFKLIQEDEKVKAYNPEALFNNIVYVGDLFSFISNFIQSDYLKNYIVSNIASKNPLTMKKVIDILFQLSSKKPNIEFKSTKNKSFTIDTNFISTLKYELPSVKSSLLSFVKSNTNLQKNNEVRT